MPHGTSDRSDDDPIQNGDGLASRDDEHGSALALGFSPPDVTLRGSHQGSSLIIAIVALSAQPISASDWGTLL